MKIPTPQELGLPEKFERWRPVQEEAFGHLIRSQARTDGLMMTVGSGKTALYVGYALYSKRPTAFVTESRGLQDQLLAEFGEVGMVDLRGRRNYDCRMRSDYTCEEGYAARCPFKGSMACPSSSAEARASASFLVVTNYDKWTSARKFGAGMNHFQQVVFDEGHQASAALARAMQVPLNRREVEHDLGMDFIDGDDAGEMTNWIPWAMKARVIAEEEMFIAREDIASGRPSVIKHYLHMRQLTKRLTTISRAKPDNWIVDDTKDGVVFDPVRPGAYGEAALLLRIPRILFVSGTLRKKALHMCGIPSAQFNFREFASEFDPKRCPIYYIPTMPVDSRHPDLSMLWVLLDQIAAPRQDRKGLVGTVSYARRDEILAKSRFAPQMFINERGEAPTEIVQEFKLSRPGSILVSPSIGTGYDFPLKDCEWLFLCKIPFSSPSKIQKAREADDREYAAYHAVLKMEQFFGRGMRQANDQCEGFIGDDNLRNWFLRSFGHLLSTGFKQRFKQVDRIPPPPPRL